MTRRRMPRDPPPRPPPQALGLGLRGPAAAARAGRGGRGRRARAPRLRARPRSSGRSRSRTLELAPPRLEPPGSLAHICRTDRYERAAHAYGKSYRDVVRAFRGRFDNPPDVVAHPADEAEVERVLAWCEEAGAAAIPFGGGTSVVGGVEPPRRPRRR